MYILATPILLLLVSFQSNNSVLTYANLFWFKYMTYFLFLFSITMRSKSTPTPYFGLVQTNNYRRLNTLVGKSKTKSFHGSSSIHGADTDSLTADSGNTSNSDVESTVLDYCDSDEQCYPETHASDSVSESSYCAAPLNQPLYEKEADRRDGPSAAAIDDLQAVDLSVKSTAITAIHEVSKHNAVIPAVPSSSPMVAKPVAPPLSSSTNYSTALVPTSKSATSISQMSHLKQEPMETEDGGLVEMNKCHQCSYCFRIFMREKNLWNHIQSVHSKVTEQKKKYTYKCSECSYTSNHYSNWYIHLRIHTGEHLLLLSSFSLLVEGTQAPGAYAPRFCCGPLDFSD